MKKHFSLLDIPYWSIVLLWAFILWLDLGTGFQVMPNGKNPLFLVILIPIGFHDQRKFLQNCPERDRSHTTDTYRLGLFIYALHYLNYLLDKFALLPIQIKNASIMTFVLICAIAYKIWKYKISKKPAA